MRCGLACKWAGSKMMSDRQQAHATVTETKNNKGQEQNRKRRRTVAQLLLTSACRHTEDRGTTVKRNENREPWHLISSRRNKKHARVSKVVNCFSCSRRVSRNVCCCDLSCLNSDGSVSVAMRRATSSSSSLVLRSFSFVSRSFLSWMFSATAEIEGGSKDWKLWIRYHGGKTKLRAMGEGRRRTEEMESWGGTTAERGKAGRGNNENAPGRVP